jgi:hypothetical protein
MEEIDVENERVSLTTKVKFNAHQTMRLFIVSGDKSLDRDQEESNRDQRFDGSIQYVLVFRTGERGDVQNSEGPTQENGSA